VPSELPSRFIAEAIVDQLTGIGGSESVGFGNGKVRSLADGVAKILGEHLNLVKDSGQVLQQQPLPLVSKRADLCSECGQASLVMEEGCSKCYLCGASKC